MEVGVQRHAPAALPLGKTRYPLCRKLDGGPQSQSGQVWKIPPPPGLDPRTFQPVASRCIDWAIPAPSEVCYVENKIRHDLKIMKNQMAVNSTDL